MQISSRKVRQKSIKEIANLLINEFKLLTERTANINIQETLKIS